MRLSDVRGDAGKRNRRPVDPRHKQTTQHDLVEVGVRATCSILLVNLLKTPRYILETVEFIGILHTREETIEFHENLQVNVLALRRLAMGAAHMVTVQVDTCIRWSSVLYDHRRDCFFENS